MKKRLIATVVAGAVLSTGLLGLTACGLSIPKGEQIADAETWKKAFERTDDLTNYTFETSYSDSQTVSGTVNKNYSYNDFYETPDNVSHNYTSNNSVTRLVLFDQDNNKAYTEMSSNSDSKGRFKGEEINSKSSEINKAYYELSKEGESYNYYWRANYAKSESKDLKAVSSQENYWTAKEITYFADSAVSPLYRATYYESEAAESSTYLYDMYDMFTYSGGVYTANLYMNVTIGRVKTVRVECEVKLSFKDGYVIGLSYKAGGSDKAYENNRYNLEYTFKTEGVYSLSNVNSTDVSKKSNKDIIKAIDKAKSEKTNA